MRELNQKRRQVFIAILAAISGNSLVMAAPSPNIENIKNLFLTSVNVVMFIIVWDTYFDEQLSQKSIISVLQDLLAITCISLITAFIVAKGIIKSIDSLINTMGSFGWLIAGMSAGLATGILGLVWAFYCDDYYRNSIDQ